MLRERLKKAEADEQKIEELAKTLEYTEKNAEEARHKLYKHDEITKREAAVKEREDVVAERERDLRVELAEGEAMGAVNRANDIFRLVDKLFSNPIVKRNKLGQVPIIERSSDGSSWTNHQSVDINETETTE